MKKKRAKTTVVLMVSKKPVEIRSLMMFPVNKSPMMLWAQEAQAAVLIIAGLLLTRVSAFKNANVPGLLVAWRALRIQDTSTVM